MKKELKKQKSRKFLWTTILFASFTFTLGFSYNYYLPSIKSWLLVSLESLSQKHSPIRVWPEEVDIQLFPPSVEFKNVKFLPKENEINFLKPFLIKNLNVQLSPFSLIRGKFIVSDLKIDSTNLEVDFDILEEFMKSSNTNNKSTLTLKQIYNLPIDQISFKNIEFKLYSKSKEQELLLSGSYFNITNKFDSLLFDLEFPILVTKGKDLAPLSFSLESRFLLKKSGIQISSFKAKKQSSFLVASGDIKGDLESLKISDGDFQSRTHFNLKEIREIAKAHFPNLTLPKLKGSIDLDAGFKWDNQSSKPDVKLKFRSNDFSIEEFKIGTVISEILIDDSNVSSSLITIHNNSGELNIKNFKIETKNPYSFTSEINNSTVELKKLLMNLSVPEIPLHLDMLPNASCSGTISPVKIICKGQVEAKNLDLKTSIKKGGNTIVIVPKMLAIGSVEIDSNDVKYNAKVNMNDSSNGTSSGTINYKNGFSIDFTGAPVDFKDIDNLVNLKFEGKTTVSGHTEGDSHSATLKMKLNSSNFWIQDFPLGSVDTQLRYKSGILTFRDVLGNYKSTRYKGNLSIDLINSKLLLNGDFPFIDIEDLRYLFARYYLLPMKLEGSGTAKINLNGPLDIHRLSYSLNSSFFRGNIQGESFDELQAKFESVDGNINIDQFLMKKSLSKIFARGSLNSTGQLDIQLEGNDLRLEQSENLEQLNLNMTGNLDFLATLTGNIKSPQLETQGRLSQLVVGDRSYEDSNVNVKLNSQNIQAQGQLMGEAVKAQIIYPFNSSNPFRLNLSTRELNFSRLFNIFGPISNRKEFDAKLTAHLDLSSENGQINKSNGSLSINDFSISRNSTSMSINKPLNISIVNGVANSETFEMNGMSTLMTVKLNPSTIENLDFSANGKLDMGLGLLLFPFLEDLRGSLSLSSQVKGSVWRPELLGSAFIENGLFVIKDFPHPFENIKADLLFNHKNIVINAAQGNLGGGQFSANGQIHMQSLTDVPLDIKGQFKDVNLEVINGVKTKGSGIFYINGNWFPYELGGKFDVVHGEITKELGAGGLKSTKSNLRAFLPDFLNQEKFQPLKLNWDVNLSKPILVKNNTIDAFLTGQLNVKGLLNDPKLKGRLDIEKDGKIFFRDTQFEVGNGRIEFLGEDSENPEVYLTANARVRDEYDISLLVQGRAKDPQFNLSSQPPLTEPEIISLLALGITPNSNDDSPFDTENFTTQTTLQLGSALLQKPLKNINKLTGVDFDVAGATGSDGVVVPNLILKKQWTPKFGISASRTVENKPINNAKIEYKMNRNLSVVGTWENKENNSELKDSSAEKVGVDLEYKVDFK